MIEVEVFLEAGSPLDFMYTWSRWVVDRIELEYDQITRHEGPWIYPRPIEHDVGRTSNFLAHSLDSCERVLIET